MEKCLLDVLLAVCVGLELRGKCCRHCTHVGSLVVMHVPAVDHPCNEILDLGDACIWLVHSIELRQNAYGLR